MDARFEYARRSVKTSVAVRPLPNNDAACGDDADDDDADDADGAAVAAAAAVVNVADAVVADDTGKVRGDNGLMARGDSGRAVRGDADLDADNDDADDNVVQTLCFCRTTTTTSWRR